MNFRNLHSGDSSVHRSKCTPEPGINRDAVRVLHGGKRRDLPAIRVGGSDESIADGVVPGIVLPDVDHLHVDMALCSAGARERGDAGDVHGGSSRGSADVSLHGPAGEETGTLGGPVNAMATIHLYFLEHFPFGGSR